MSDEPSAGDVLPEELSGALPGALHVGGAAHDEAAASDATEQWLRLAEALIFASAGPVTPRALSQLLPEEADAAAVLEALRARYEGHGVELVEAGGGWLFRTAPDLAPALKKTISVPRRLPRVAMETLAIIAYHQPVTRPEIEEIRGTSLAQQTLDALLEAGLIGPRGRKETPGRPTLWGTAPGFLTQFGLKDLRELPRREDLLIDMPTVSTAPAEAQPAEAQQAEHQPDEPAADTEAESPPEG